MGGLEGEWPEQQQRAQELEDFETLFGGVKVFDPNDMDVIYGVMEAGPSTTSNDPYDTSETADNLAVVH